MRVEKLLQAQVKRLSPFEGLAIDAEAWRDAHDYHRLHQQLHTLACHGYGIVAGLEVTAFDPPDLSVLIHPGLAIDPEGNVIVVAQQQRYHLGSHAGGPVYLVIQFREIPVDEQPSYGDGALRPTRILEAYRVEERDHLPAEPHLELARVRLRPQATDVRDAISPWSPADDEIDQRFRITMALRPQHQTTIGFARYGPPDWDGWRRHTEGLQHLLRELPGALQVHLVETAPPHIADCDLLYIVGQGPLRPTDEERQALTGFLATGGVLLAETCPGGDAAGAREFEQSFIAMAQAMGWRLEPLGCDHPLLKAHHMFSGAPPGAAGEGGLLAGEGVLLSTWDYGCAWCGGSPDRPLPRETIRAAIELGANLAVYAAQAREGLRKRQAPQRSPSL